MKQVLPTSLEMTSMECIRHGIDKENVKSDLYL